MMGQLLINLVLLSLILCAFVLIYGIVKSCLETDEEIKLLKLKAESAWDAVKDHEDKLTALNARIIALEDWADLAVVWMNNQQTRTKRLSAEVSKLKDTSIYVGGDDSTVPDLIKEEEKKDEKQINRSE